MVEEGRISIILWGWVDQAEDGPPLRGGGGGGGGGGAGGGGGGGGGGGEKHPRSAVTSTGSSFT